MIFRFGVTMNLSKNCIKCGCEECPAFMQYVTKTNGSRTLLKCKSCQTTFSETHHTFMFNLKTPLSKIALVLNARTEGMSFNATCRSHAISPNTLQHWETKFGALKDVLFLYSVTHLFIEMLIEGDELYTKVNRNVPPEDSEGWTISLMDRASRFLWELTCDRKHNTLFLKAIQCLVKVIECTKELTLLTDGERRYSALLFNVCYDLLHTGKRGRPKKVLKSGVKIRVKNKGSQSKKPGPKREKYQAPKPEHPEKTQDVVASDIHANHQEGQNASFRRKLSPYRRKTNTYAKSKGGLQRVLDVYWVMHNFVRQHVTTKKVPAVGIGILESAMSLENIMMDIRIVF